MDPKSFLMGSGNPGFSFLRVGDGIVGKIVGEPTVQQQKKFGTNDPDFWPSGDPKLQMLVPVETNFRNYEGIANPDRAVADTGMRTLYVKGKHFESAMRIAIRATGAQFLDIGGILEVVYTGDDMTSKAGSKPKMFAVRYTPPAPSQQAFLGTQGGQGYQTPGFAPQAAPQPVYAPPPQIPVSHSEPWPPQVTPPAHHSQGPVPDWAAPAPQVPAQPPISAPPASVPPVTNTIELLRSQMAGKVTPTDDTTPPF